MKAVAPGKTEYESQSREDPSVLFVLVPWLSLVDFAVAEPSDSSGDERESHQVFNGHEEDKLCHIQHRSEDAKHDTTDPWTFYWHIGYGVSVLE